VSRPTRWAILTGEYPPQAGGVADYTRQIAAGLTATGDAVTVFAPPVCGWSECADPGVAVVRLPDHFGPRGLGALGRALVRCRPDRILVQYVPHAYGYKSMNLPFVVWLARRPPRIAPLWVMFHEVAVPFGWRPAVNLVLGTAHRLMAQIVAGAADRIFVSVPAWEAYLRAVRPLMRAPVEWLPIPSNIPVAAASEPSTRTVVAHFGTYGAATVDLLEPALVHLLNRPMDCVGLLIGRGGETFRDRLVDRHPRLAGRLYASGELPQAAVAAHLASSSILLQPFVDGISSRRTTAMAGLANGVPLVSNLGPLSEPFWARVTCIRLSPRPDPLALADEAEAVLALSPASRAEIGRQAAAFYREQFAIENTLARLQTTP